MPDKPLIFGGPGKLESELQQAVQLGVEVLHVESLTELHRLQAIALRENQTVSVLLRMNIVLDGIGGTRLMMGGKPTPFGLDEQELPAALREIAASP